MAAVTALARTVDRRVLEARAIEGARLVIVSGCALALIAAGRAFPF